MGARCSICRLTVALCALCMVVLLGSASALAAEAPTIELEDVSNVEFAGANLVAQINPNEAETHYRFEYGPDTSYGTTVPATEGSAGTAYGTVTVKQFVSGLEAGGTYHFRVIASNPEGTTVGPDRIFHTFVHPAPETESCGNAATRAAQFAEYLPNCRAYEMVSPLHKNGGNIAADPTLTQAAIGGNAIKYTSTAAFGEVFGMEARGNEYLSQRGADGWSTHAINANQVGQWFPILTSEYAYLTEDLSKGVFLSLSPLTEDHPNVENVANLYLRSDVFSASPGSYELLSDAVAPVTLATAFSTPQVAFGGASEDMTHIAFESLANLTPETSALPSGPKAYEWDSGVLRLAGILPNGEPAESSIVAAGAGALGQTNRTRSQYSVSSDGSRVLFTAPPYEDADNGWSGNEAMGGQIYMRVNGSETLYLNESERTTPDSRGTLPAFLWTATSDDSQVFFTTEEALTDDASEGNLKFYRYDVNAPAHERLTLLASAATANGSKGAFNGVSADGSYVYFSTATPLRPGDPEKSSTYEHGDVYVLHNGELRFIATRVQGPGDPTWNEALLGRDGFRVLPDGKAIIFVDEDPGEVERVTGEPNPYPAERTERTHVFVYRYDANKVYCVSCSPTDAYPTGSGAGFSNLSTDTNAVFQTTGGNSVGYLNRPLTEDGRYAFFDTPDALVAQDINSKRDVYEYDTLTQKVRLISSGTCDCGSYFVDASADGKDVFFTTYQKLVRSDVDSNADMYDARIDGGIASQNEPAGAPCSGDDCQGPVSGAPAFSLPSSLTFAGVGNPAAVAVKAKVKAKMHKKHKRRHKKRKHRRHTAHRSLSRRVGR